MKSYTQALPAGISLAVFNGDDLIFTSGAKWLHPLFALEEFLLTYNGERDMLSAHDTAAGKAAAILMARPGIKLAHINLVSDLGIEKQMLKDVRVVLRPAKKHRFRINYLPMTYDASTTITREFIFNGLRYRPGLPVQTTAQFKTWRFGYEYDFLYRDRGFLGVLLDAK